MIYPTSNLVLNNNIVVSLYSLLATSGWKKGRNFNAFISGTLRQRLLNSFEKCCLTGSYISRKSLFSFVTFNHLCFQACAILLEPFHKKWTDEIKVNEFKNDYNSCPMSVIETTAIYIMSV